MELPKAVFKGSGSTAPFSRQYFIKTKGCWHTGQYLRKYEKRSRYWNSWPTKKEHRDATGFHSIVILRAFTGSRTPSDFRRSEVCARFLSYRDDDIEKLSHKRKKFGLIDEVVHELYEAFFDLVYYGSKEETWFLETFSLSENDLGTILA